jgi:hypothetical protein
MGGILQVDTIQNNNASNLITQTNVTTITMGGTHLEEVNIPLTQGNIKIQNLNVVGSTFSDAGIIFDGTSSIKSGVFTEVDGEILSYAINAEQIDDSYDSVRSGGIFRLDTRTSGGTGNANCFVVKSKAANTTTQVNALVVDFNTRDLYFDSGYGSAGIAYGCRAWVNFNGTGTPAIREDGNVTSITDGGTGIFTVNFTIAMPDVNYCLVGACKQTANTTGQNSIVAPAILNTTSIQITTQGGSTLQDMVNTNVSVFR